MKICALTHTYPRFPNDINAPFVESLMEHIAGCGHDVAVLTAYDPAWNRRPDDHTLDLRTYRYIVSERLHVLGYSRTIEGNIRFRGRVYALAPFMFLGAYRAFRRLVREKRPDVLHAHWILPNGFIAARVARETGIPLLIQLHGSDVFTAEKLGLFRVMARSAGRAASYIVTPSPDLTRRLGALGLDTRKFGLVPNTVEAGFSRNVADETVAGLRNRLNIPAGDMVVLAMGRLVYVKGFEYLLRAFAKIAAGRPDVTLVLAGDGVMADELRGLARSLGIEARIRMPGAVDRMEVPVYFRLADVFVVPSIRHESGAVDGLPVVVPEAMAAGVPIVASDLSGIPVVVRDGVNGRLVPERDADAIARTVGELLDNHKKRESFGAVSRKIVDERLNYDAVAGHFIRLYEALVAGTPAEHIPSFPPLGA